MSAASGRVTVVGSVNLDLSVRVQRHPRPGETVLGSAAVRSAGGKGANQAVAAARAGRAATAFVGAIGADAEGAELVRTLRSQDVTTVVDTVDHVSTGLALITVDDDAENSIVVVPGANAHLRVLGREARQTVAAADVVLCQLEVPLEALAACADARRDGSTLILNAAPSARVPDDVWPLLDLLVVNEHEAMELADSENIDEAIEVLVVRVPAVIVTQGARGCTYASRDGSRTTIAAWRVTAVDTTAAGDTFCGVLAARMAAGDSMVTAMTAAAAAAALTTSRPGAQASIPTFAETEELMQQARP